MVMVAGEPTLIRQLTIDDYYADVTADVRAEAWEYIQKNYPCLCHLMRRKHRDAMRAAKTMRLVDSETDVDESVRAALPHVCRSVVAWIQQGKPGSLTTYLGWGLMSWRRDVLNWQDKEHKVETAATIKAETVNNEEPSRDIADYLHLLNRSEKYVIAMMREGYTLNEIAKQKRCTHATISSILKSAVQKMREYEETSK